MLKRLLSLILILAAVLSLSACGAKTYPQIASTAEDSTTVMTLSLEGERYEVKYELYRALFLSYKSYVDGGATEVWSSAEKDTYIEKIDAMILSSAADIYATLHLANKLDINPYSASVDSQIEEYITGSVDGYVGEDFSAIGFEGDYNAYLKSIYDMGINYSVQRLLLRYAIVSDKILEYYAGTKDEENPTPGMTDGALEYTEEDVRAYYNGDECVRALLTTLDARSFTKERALEIRNKLASYSDTRDIINYIMNFTATTEADATSGVLIGRHSLDAAYYGALTEEAFNTPLYGVSDVVTVSSDAGDSYYILYRVDKDDDYYSENLIDIESSFVKNQVGKILSEVKASLCASMEKADLLSSLNRGEIKAPEAPTV